MARQYVVKADFQRAYDRLSVPEQALVTPPQSHMSPANSYSSAIPARVGVASVCNPHELSYSFDVLRLIPPNALYSFISLCCC